MIVTPHSNTADVMRRTIGKVDSPETQPGLHGIQRGHAPGLLRDADVPLNPGLATGVDLADRLRHGSLGLLPEGIQTLIEVGDELLFVLQFLA
ncbi:hypothetical protein [Streptomyces sp. NPDC088725]|uniref:hypothetical protein n=1 Tax=Streptomyces sp. NPDC088725 TaxID=3365873 RepID=UPI00380D4DC7